MRNFFCNYFNYYIKFILIFLSMINFNYVLAIDGEVIHKLSKTEKMLLNLKMPDQACKILNKKIVTYIDSIFFVKNCKLMKITDPEVSNQLIQIHKKEIINLPPDLYAKMQLSKDYTYFDYEKDFNDDSEFQLVNLCEKYNNNIVTSNNLSYYYIENCKKRIFNNDKELYYFSKKSKPIFSLKPRMLAVFPNGKPIVVEKKNEESIFAVSESEIKQNLPPKKVLCKNLENKIVSFHDSIFFLSKCQLYVIKDFSLEIQQKADSYGGIKELSVQQAIGIPQVGFISSKDVIKKMR